MTGTTVKSQPAKQKESLTKQNFLNSQRNLVAQKIYFKENFWIKCIFGQLIFFFSFYREALLQMTEKINNWELETELYILLTLPTNIF